MRNHYEPGAVRWKRWDGGGDVRLYRPTKGWDAEAMLLDEHPITGRPLRPLDSLQWWIREEYKADDQ